MAGNGRNTVGSVGVGVGPGGTLGPSAVGAVGAGRGVRAARVPSPRVLNPHAQHSQHRPPRPRTPLLQVNNV